MITRTTCNPAAAEPEAPACGSGAPARVGFVVRELLAICRELIARRRSG